MHSVHREGVKGSASQTNVTNLGRVLAAARVHVLAAAHGRAEDHGRAEAVLEMKQEGNMA